MPKPIINAWIKELPAEVMVCAPDGTILEMNLEAAALFAAEGGLGLLGQDVLACHPDASRQKFEHMIAHQIPNAYFNTEKGETRFFFQSPWFKDNAFAGFVEISFQVPAGIPHFKRG